MERLLLALALLGLIFALALLLKRRSAAAPQRVDLAELGVERDSGVTVVGFSTPYCLPCREWEAALAEAGIPFRKVDISERPELARRYRVRSTPLVLAVRKPGGEVVATFTDAPRDGEVARLRELTDV
jgi:thiol-disulfide isomerase/thioredoxin